MDVAFNQVRFACVSGIEKYAENGAKLISILASRDGSYKTNLGIQEDYSYHFHGHGINMGYGRFMLRMVSRFIYITAGTKFSLPEKSLEYNQDWFRKFIIFNSFKGHVSPFTIGRSISRDKAVIKPVELEAAMFLYLSEGSSCKDLALSFIKEWYDAMPGEAFYNTTIAALAPKIEPDLEKAEPMPTGVRFYPASDYLAARMGKFYTAVLMSSKRTKAWHSIRDENIRGHRSGDGTLVVMTDGHEFDNNIIPTMDWYNPSGVTVARKVRARSEHDGYATVVGGLAHRNITGMAGMDFVIKNGERILEARKSYTVTPRGIVLAGTRIRCSNLEKEKTFQTSLHQCPLRDRDTRLIVDGKTMPIRDGSQMLTVKKWMHVRNYGYIFPEPTEVRLRITTTERDYTYINRRYGTKTKYKARFYTLFKNHDAGKDDNTYSVIIIPEISPDQMKQTVTDAFLELQCRTESLHVIADKAARTKHFYFFEKGGNKGFTASRPLFFSVSQDDNHLYATLQDPSHAGGEVVFGVPFRVSSTGRGVQVKSTGKSSEVRVNLDKGWSRELTFSIR